MKAVFDLTVKTILQSVLYKLQNCQIHVKQIFNVMVKKPLVGFLFGGGGGGGGLR